MRRRVAQREYDGVARHRPAAGELDRGTVGRLAYSDRLAADPKHRRAWHRAGVAEHTRQVAAIDRSRQEAPPIGRDSARGAPPQQVVRVVAIGTHPVRGVVEQMLASGPPVGQPGTDAALALDHPDLDRPIGLGTSGQRGRGQDSGGTAAHDDDPGCGSRIGRADRARVAHGRVRSIVSLVN